MQWVLCLSLLFMVNSLRIIHALQFRSRRSFPASGEIKEVPHSKVHGMQEDTASISGLGDLTDQVASTFCECNCQEPHLGRADAEKCLKNTGINDEEKFTYSKVKRQGFQSGKGAPEKCSTSVKLKEQDAIQNAKAENIHISSIPGVEDVHTSGTNPNCRHHPEIIIIIDDDGDDDENYDDSELNTEEVTSDTEQDGDDVALESDARSSKNPRSNSCRSVGQRPNSSRHFISHSTNCSDSEDDCQMFEPDRKCPFTSLRHMKRHYRKKPSGRMSVGCYRYVSENIRSLDSDSSDCELMEGSSGEIREQWEEAALRKRVARGLHCKQYEVEEEASASGSNLNPNSPLRECVQEAMNEGLNADFQGHYAEGCSRDPPDVASASGINYMSGQADVTSFRTTKEFEEQNPSIPGANTSEGISPGQSTDTVEVQPSAEQNECDECSSRVRVEEALPGFAPSISQQQGNANLRYTSEGAKTEFVSMDNLNEWIGAREKLKETAEFKHAEEEEWAHRQLELQRQAEEAQRLRKRKRAEATRRLEMERRQKQRIEEMRETQKKDEETMDLKEHLRSQVRVELEQAASKCKDMASLLRCLGIFVEGGPFPLLQQVNAAYKQALLRFHPDHASKGDLRHQVEAEETFKLISRLKDTLLPVASTYLNRPSW